MREWECEEWEGRMSVARWLEIVAGLFALGAAGFWFLSASPWDPLPQMLTYWGFTPESDPFRQAIVFSAKMNGYAALCSFFGAILAAIRLFMGNVRPEASRG